MKIKEYNQMIGYLTRPSKSTDPKQVKVDLEKTLNKYEDGPDIVESDLVVEDKVLKHKRAEGYYRRNAALGDTTGAWKNFVASNKAKTATKEEKPIQDIEHPNQVSFDPTTRLFSNKARTIAYQNYDDADNYNKKMGFKKTKYYPDEATPEQVGALATILEKHRQMTGSDGRYDKQKVIIKRKKLSVGTLPKIHFTAPAKLPLPSIPDPRLEIAERNFNKMLRDNEAEKIKNNNSGIAGLLGEIK